MWSPAPGSRGETNARIAHELSIAERTVAFHVSNVLEKLDAESRIDAAMWAKDQGIVARTEGESKLGRPATVLSGRVFSSQAGSRSKNL